MAIFNILRSKSSYRSLFSGKLVGSYMKSHRQSDLSLHCGTARECIRHQSVAQSFINSGKVVGSYMKGYKNSDMSLHYGAGSECIRHQSVANRPVLNLEKDYLRDRSFSFMKSGLAAHYGTMSRCIRHHSLANRPALNFEKVYLMDKSISFMKSNLVHYGTLRSIRHQSFAKFFSFHKLLHFSTKSSCSDSEFSVYELEFDNGTLTIAIVGLDYFIFISDGLGFGKNYIIERYRRRKIICIGEKVLMMRSGYNRFPMHIQSSLEEDVKIFGGDYNLNSESCAYSARCYMNEVWWGNPELEDRVYKFNIFFGCFEFGRPRIFHYSGWDDSVKECSTVIRGYGKDEVQKVIKLHLLNGINYTPSEAVVQSLRQSVVYACLHAYPPVGGNILLMEARKGKITTLFNASFERLDGTCALLVKIGLLTPDDYFPCTPFRKRKI